MQMLTGAEPASKAKPDSSGTSPGMTGEGAWHRVVRNPGNTEMDGNNFV